jgi:hypothetical protein
LYGPRHNLPSVADKAHAPDEVRDRVGDWKGKDNRNNVKMADRYSFAGFERHAEVRSALLALAGLAIKDTMMATASKAPSWEQVFDNWPKGAKGRLTCSSSFPEEPLQVEVQYALVEKVIKEQTESSSSDDSEDSARSSAGTELPFEIEDAVAWQKSSHPKGLLHVRTDKSLVCGRALRRPVNGIGLRAAKEQDAEFSPRCFASLSEAQRAIWIEDD